MAPRLVESIPVIPTNPANPGPKVRVLYYEDGSIRFRIYKAPLVIEEAYLQSKRDNPLVNNHAIIKVSPR